jgi:ribosomal protein S12 methylthiotransferase accessory factor
VQIDTPDVEVLTTDILPLLDGTRDKQQVAAAVRGYSRRGILKLLDCLERYGLLEIDVCPTIDSEDRRALQKFRQLLASWVDRRAGIIKYLTSDPPDPSKLNVAWTSAAILNPSKFAADSRSKTTGFGAGLTAIEAMTKAAAEAMELYAASHYSQSDLFNSSLPDLGEDFLDPRQLCLYQRKQYQQLNFPFVRFTPRRPIYWTRGKWLDTGKSVWLPALLTYFGGNFPTEEQFSQVTTSGLATGITVEDASRRAIWELVERDAFMITWLCRLPARRLVLDSALEDGALGIIREFEMRGMEVRLYLLNAGINIPVMLCVVLGDGKNWPGATIGLGAHDSPVTATRKAILEQALMGPALRREMLAGKRRIPRRPQDIGTPLDHALYYIPRKRARAFDFLESRESPPVSLSDLEKKDTTSLNACVKRLKAAGVRVAIKDLTPTDLSSESSFCVVRALATTLQPIHFGFDLVRLGSPRLKRMMKTGINPNPHPLA